MDALGSHNIQHHMSGAMDTRNQSDLENLQKRLNNPQDMQMERTRAAAEEFEAVFLSQMLGHMFSGIEVDPMFGGGNGEEMFKGMMVEEYGKQLASTGGIGIADQVQAKLIEMQSQL